MSETKSLPRTPLRQVVEEIELGAAAAGWDRPATLFALVFTAQLLEAPDLPDDVAKALRAGWDGTDSHLSAIAQETLPEDNLEELLTQILWPETVAGAAVSVERLTLPPAVEDQVPADPAEALEFVSKHPLRTDVRIVAGVSRSQEAWCTLRTRTFDDPDHVGKGPNLVPSLIEGLLLGFTPPEEPPELA